MIESILAVIIGGLFGTIVFVLPAFLIRAVYRKRRAVKEKAKLESQLEGMREESYRLPELVRSRLGSLSFVVFCLLVIMWGVMTGFVVGLFSNLIYLVFVFPLVIGIVNGSIIADLVEKAKLRRPTQVIILSVISAVAIYGMLHYGRYAGFVVSTSSEISSDASEALEVENLSMAKAFLDYALEEETGHPGFLGYMLYRANEGISIGRLARSRSVNLGPVLTWMYWLLELGIILGVTIQKGRKATNARVCEACGSLYGGEKHLGGTTSTNEPLLVELIRQKDFAEMGRLIKKNADLPSIEVYFQGCKICGKSPSQLVVRHAFQGAKGDLRFRDALQTTLPPAESAQLLSQVSFSGD